MLYRPLGETQESVSVLSFGGAPLGNLVGPDWGEGIAAVRYAVDAGINLFDVSPLYGHAEDVMGEALVGLRDRVLISTKAGNYPNGSDFRRERILASVEESLRRLKTDRIDLLLLHDIENAEPSQLFGEAYEAVQTLKAQGKCRWVGMSGYPLRILRGAVVHCSLDVVLTYSHFCLCNITAGKELIPYAHQHGAGVINAAPFSMGLLADAGPPLSHPAPPILAQAVREAADFCRRHGASLSQLALQYALLLPLITTEERPLVATTLVGIKSREELRANLDALDAPFDWDLLVDVQEIFLPAMNLSWGGEAPFPDSVEGDTSTL